MFKIETPRDKDPHTLADFAELLCLLTTDRVLGGDTLVDHISDNGGGVSDDEKEDCFAQLVWRQAAFGAHYPFEIDGARHVISANEALTDEQRLYALLLLCANLPIVSDRRQLGPLTNAFERASLVALMRLWPQAANIKAFGKNETDYVGSKWERINKLGRDIGGRPQLSEQSFRRRDTGDGGIDLVAWLDLDPYEPENIPSGLGQCACSREDWSAKQAEISGFRLQKLLVPTHPWMELIFVPICFRNNQGRWAIDGDVATAVLIDRLRLLSVLKADLDLAEIDPPEVFETFLEARLDLV